MLPASNMFCHDLLTYLHVLSVSGMESRRQIYVKQIRKFKMHWGVYNSTNSYLIEYHNTSKKLKSDSCVSFRLTPSFYTNFTDPVLIYKWEALGLSPSLAIHFSCLVTFAALCGALWRCSQQRNGLTCARYKVLCPWLYLVIPVC